MNIICLNEMLLIEVKIHENDEYIISTGFEQFKNHMQEKISKNPKNYNDIRLFNSIYSESKTNSKIDAISINSKLSWNSSLEYHIADLLQNGNCKVFSKKSGEYIRNIHMKHYSFKLGSLSGEGGRMFMIDGERFYSVEDWIS
jgi:hypothetical protein